ncbi:MAG: biopolymer transporter ExbD [Deltaproteobacteria bacterium]|nr:biopolymer transporter ExbD [Deltaproteobacteria bacterium]
MNLDSPLNDPWSEDDSLDMTSLIDVIFLLLAFFILTATFAAPAMDVRLSEADNATPVRAEESALTITVDAEGLVYRGEQVLDADALRRIIQNHPAGAAIYFNVDQAAPFGAFLEVLDEAKGQRRERFMINARPRTGGRNAELDGVPLAGTETAETATPADQTVSTAPSGD